MGNPIHARRPGKNRWRSGSLENASIAGRPRSPKVPAFDSIGMSVSLPKRAWKTSKPTLRTPVSWRERAAGTPKQTFRRLVRYAVDGFFSFSYLPLRVLTYTGIAVSGLGFLLGLYFIAKRLLGIETATTGFTTLVSLVTFLGGIQLIGIGVLGEYLGRVYDEVKQRPIYLVRPPRR